MANTGSGDLNIRINADTSQAQQNIRSLEKTVSSSSSNIASSWKSVGAAQEGLVAKTNNAIAALEKQNAKIREANNLLNENAKISSSGNKGMPSLPSYGYQASLPANPWKTTFDALDKSRASSSNAAAGMVDGFNKWAIASRNVTESNKETLQSTEKLHRGISGLGTEGLPTLRYALYDVANVTGRFSKALLGSVEDSIKASMAFETAWTEIERTTMANSRRLELMNIQFKDLARNIPLAFADITRIGALGAQMNIANSDLAGFTETVAQFSATTNVSIDTAAQSFGALGNLMNIKADEFKNLGSAIAYVGINSVATESEILSVATAISGVAAQADVSKEYMVGLSGALASLRVPAEQSRGALTRIFQEVNRSAAEGGQAIQNFGNVVGMSGKEVQALLKQDNGMEQFFQRFITGLHGMDSQQLTTTLDALSLSDIRVTNVLARLSSNIDVVNKSLLDSNYGFKNGTILAQLYAKKNEDLASRMTRLNNSVQELSASFGDALNSSIGDVVDILSGLVNGLNDAISTDAGKFFTGFIVIMGALVGVLGMVVTGIITATAAAAALKVAMITLGIEGATTGLAGFVRQLFTTNISMVALTGSMGGAAFAANALKIALIAIPFVAIIGGAIALFAAFNQAAGNADIAFKNLIGTSSGLKTALESDAAAYRKMKDAGATQEELAQKFTVVDLSAEQAKVKVGEYSSGVENMGQALDVNIPKLKGLGDEFDNNTRIIGENTEAWVTNALMANENFQKMFEDKEFTKYIDGIRKAGFSIGELIKIQAQGGTQQDMLRYIYDMQEAARKQGINIPVNLVDSNGVIMSPTDGFGSNNVVSNLVGITDALGGLTSQYYLAQTGLDGMDQSANGAGDGIENLDDKIKDATPVVRTFVDYANDFSSVWKRAFDLRFAKQDAFDQITKGWNDVRESTQAAREELQKINDDLQKQTADKSLLEYYLSVAEAVGDTVKAEQLRAQIAEAQTKLDDTRKQQADAQDATNKTLKGNSKAAIENRKTVTGMVSTYSDYIQSLIASGASQKTINAAIAQSKQDFINQATSIGYSRDEIKKYAQSFDDMKKVAADPVVSKVTVKIEGLDAAQAALKEFKAKNNNMTISPSVDGDAAARSAEIAGLKAAKKYQETYLEAILGPNPSEARKDALMPGYKALIKNIDDRLKKLGAYATGGYTGAGGKYQPAGIVHKGEYVVPREQVNQNTGLPYYMQQPRSFAQGGYAGASGPMMVSLSPEDRAILRNAGGSGEVVLYANNEAIARSSNAGNQSIIAFGGRP